MPYQPKHRGHEPEVYVETLGSTNYEVESNDAECECFLCPGWCQEAASTDGDYCSCDRPRTICPACYPNDYSWPDDPGARHLLATVLTRPAQPTLIAR